MNYIGIDPDVEKSGFAVWNKEEKRILLSYTKALNFWEVIQELDAYNKDRIEIFIEAGWLNKKSNFHPTQLKLVGERIAKNVGANHQIGKLIEEYCIKYNIKYRLIRPTAHKWTSEQCFKFTGIKEKNQDVIDAIRLVFGR